jgi:hypothetical protein
LNTGRRIYQNDKCAACCCESIVPRDKIFSQVNIYLKRRSSLSKFTIRIVPVLVVLLLAGVKPANAQVQFSPYFGLGSATDSQGTNGGCPPKELLDDLMNCEPAPTIGGVFGVLGADFMIMPHLGVNGEYSFRFAQAVFFPQEGLNFRPEFYDFNAVYQPTSGDSKVVPVLEGGIGGAHFPFYVVSPTIGGVPTSYSAYVSSNHFLVHGAVGVKLYVKGNIFIKPQVDIRWVDHLNQQFGRSFVPEYTVSVGYTFGRS